MVLLHVEIMSKATVKGAVPSMHIVMHACMYPKTCVSQHNMRDAQERMMLLILIT